MTLFDKVTYDFYSHTLGRAVIPAEAEFNTYRLKNVLFVKGLYDDGLIVEREADGIVKATCMMIEIDYQEGGDDAVTTSESIGGYSWSGTKKSGEARKYECLKLFCHITGGVR
nr:MAG TPA: putative head-tail connector protein [Bacteriophage sp.]